MTILLPPAAADIADTLASLDALLTASTANVRKGDMVDLAGLEREVKPILDAALGLPAEQARALLPQLEQVMLALENLSTALREVHGDKLGGTETHATRIRAAAAYRRSEEG